MKSLTLTLRVNPFTILHFFVFVYEYFLYEFLSQREIEERIRKTKNILLVSMEQKVKKLYEAAVQGSVTDLLDLQQTDGLILDRCMVTTYGETPLHVAAMLGHLEFCSELLKRKPELALELDSRRSSALHLASAKGYTEIVRILAPVCPEMCSVQDADGNNPIHVAAMKGRVDVLKELVKFEPGAARARVRSFQGETVLHLCVQYSQLESLKFLVENLNDDEFVNAKDDNGNSILHLAVADKQVQIVRFLVTSTSIDVNALNSRGLTALDVLTQMRRDSSYMDIAHCLQQSAAQKSEETSLSPEHNTIDQASTSVSGRYQILTKSRSRKKASRKQDQSLNSRNSYLNNHAAWLDRQRNSLMVVASLIATMAFQAVLSPPGGFWEEDSSGSSSPQTAGVSIFADRNYKLYKKFIVCNTIGFISSLSIILLLISGLPLTRKLFMWILMVIMWLSVSATAGTYSLSVEASVPNIEDKDHDGLVSILTNNVIMIWIGLMVFLMKSHTFRYVALLMSGWPFKLRLFGWTLMIIAWISAVFSYAGLAQLRSGIGFILITIFVGLSILISFLGLVHAYLLVRFLIRKIRGCFKGVRRRLSSSNQSAIVV